MSQPFTKQFTEGPSVLKIGEDFVIYFDAYRKGTYGAVKTRDFKSFTDITRAGFISCRPQTRHRIAEFQGRLSTQLLEPADSIEGYPMDLTSNATSRYLSIN